jgi:thiosulfate/3-mercaptopyruvate sulfurtransferase
MTPFVDADWLLRHHGDVVVVHVATTMGGGDPFAAFERRRIAGAVTVLLDSALAAPPAPIAGRHPLPSPEHFAAAMSRAGVGNDSPVVAYDDGNGGLAARLVWMLRLLGQRAALLDGGLAHWTGPTESGPVEATARSVERKVVPWPGDMLAGADEVAAHIQDGGLVIDSRSAPRYRGEVEPIDAIAGHVPGAINLDFAENFEADSRLLPREALQARFAPLDVDERSIVYCGSGVTACLNALAIEAAGFPRPKVYVGSWSGWSSDPERPVARGDELGD